MKMRVLRSQPRGDVHVTFNDERTACNVSVRTIFDINTLSSKPAPAGWWRPTRSEVNCPSCLKVLGAAQRAAAELRELAA